MTAALRKDDLYATPEEYLALERWSETKHEYLAGMIYAMAGASREHNHVARNILTEIALQLRGKRCVPFGSDMRLRIRKPAATFYYYPDVVVDCSDSDADEVEEPTVIFEVLSPESGRGDYGDKRINYQEIATMRAYVIVDQSGPAVTVYRRAGEGWTTELLSDLSATLELPEIGCALPLASIYERLPWMA